MTLAAQQRRPSRLDLVVPIVLSVVVAVTSYAASGVSLGFFFGPVLLAPIVVPPLALSVSKLSHRFAVCIIYAGASGIVWLLAGRVEISAVVRCVIVLVALVLALASLPPALVRARFQPVLASATVTILGLAWLTWPVWLARALPTNGGEYVLRWAGPVNPLFAINGTLRSYFDDWDRYQLAYQHLTTLNQDVLYSLPRSIWPSALAHLLIALGCFILAMHFRTISPATVPQK